MHTTNYTKSFIQIAEDSKAMEANIPPIKENKKTIANIQFDMIYNNPYKYESDEVIFEGFAIKNEIKEHDKPEAKKNFFSKGQACFRASALAKTYGWGFHFDDNAKVAIYEMNSEEYKSLVNDKNIKQYKAMKSKK